ncbi:ATP-binding cassette domain-containing protein [Streptomyces sp. NBC_01445]|uniref:ATP-binding cassette domain-containing protein n=1 Tax=Streptomyces sp. NBC_01445 TaxID=2903869 RepID=UPI002DD9E700|nr:ATP-binding cassette domain-containing protein [Streptomyces sp. NBC_01445]WSE03747.1 hypothetical protein OG574_10425 [Streptomyces sp. NBC_01445]
MNSGAVSTGVETTAMNPAPTQPVIKVQDVSFGYGEKTIINRVSFEAQEGEFLSLIGPFGCVKSPLPAMMDGVLTPDSGSVLVEGNIPRTGAVPAPRCPVLRAHAVGVRSAQRDAGAALQAAHLNRKQRTEIGLEYLETVGLCGCR